jgi:hypothetical protein
MQDKKRLTADEYTQIKSMTWKNSDTSINEAPEFLLWSLCI